MTLKIAYLLDIKNITSCCRNSSNSNDNNSTMTTNATTFACIKSYMEVVDLDQFQLKKQVWQQYVTKACASLLQKFIKELVKMKEMYLCSVRARRDLSKPSKKEFKKSTDDLWLNICFTEKVRDMVVWILSLKIRQESWLNLCTHISS